MLYTGFVADFEEPCGMKRAGLEGNVPGLRSLISESRHVKHGQAHWHVQQEALQPCCSPSFEEVYFATCSITEPSVSRLTWECSDLWEERE